MVRRWLDRLLGRWYVSRERYDRAAAHNILLTLEHETPRTFYVDAEGHYWPVSATVTTTQRGMPCS